MVWLKFIRDSQFWCSYSIVKTALKRRTALDYSTPYSLISLCKLFAVTCLIITRTCIAIEVPLNFWTGINFAKVANPNEWIRVWNHFFRFAVFRFRWKTLPIRSNQAHVPWLILIFCLIKSKVLRQRWTIQNKVPMRNTRLSEPHIQTDSLSFPSNAQWFDRFFLISVIADMKKTYFSVIGWENF